MNIQSHKIPATVLPVAFVISVFLLFFTVSISYKQFQSVNESEKLVLHSHKVQIELQQLQSSITDAETSQRGYLLTHDSIFLQPFRDAIVKVNHSFYFLKVMTLDNQQQQKNLNSLHSLIIQRFDKLEYVLKRSRYEFPNSDFVKVQLLLGKKIMDNIRSQIAKMIAAEMQLLKDRELNYLREINLSPLTFLLSALVSLIIFIVAYNTINKDIANLRKINNELLITQQSFEHAEQIAEISYWNWNIESNSLTYSRNQYRLLGCEPFEFEPTVEKFMEFVHPDDHSIIIEGNQKVLTESTPSVAYFRIIRKDGELRYFKSIGKIITDNYKKKIIIGINADITEQFLSDKLLKEKLNDLELSNNELSAFNHVASHDLQEPLRKIQILISRIKEKDFHTISLKGQEYFSRIQVAANRMQKLIDDLLIFSRTNKADKVLALSDLNTLLANSIQELTQIIEEKNAIINSSQLPTIDVIAFQIQQLFSNLIGNSLKYCKPNLIPVIKINSKIISGNDIPDSWKTSTKQFYAISISDNGIGFEAQYAENIFTLFQRLHSDTEIPGTGIGLAICKKIIENHKGYITASSNPNEGATFTFFLPV